MEQVTRLTVCCEQEGGGSGRTVSRVSPQVDPLAGHLGRSMLELLWTDSSSNYRQLKHDACTRVCVCRDGGVSVEGEGG